MFNQKINPVSVEMFSGGDLGLCPGACGLFSILGNSHLSSALEAARILQYRARNGAGVFLKGHYRDDSHYHIHIMFRDRGRVTDFENYMHHWGLEFLEKQPLVKDFMYYEYDMPLYMHYSILAPSVDVIRHKGGTGDVHEYIRQRVNEFNIRFKNDCRIFSSSLDGAAFTTAFELDDTIRIFDLEQYSDRLHTGVLIHMRWPTSQGQGLWWGAQPISHGNLTGIHNGHLSSDNSNARALEELGIALQVGTDSEAIFEMVFHCLGQGFSLEEVEWALSQKFPAEAGNLPLEKLARYNEISRHPVYRHFKMSGPSTAVINYNDMMVGITDRDHMRQFIVGYNEKIAVFASEERAIINYAQLTQTPLQVISPPAGRHVAFLGEWDQDHKKGYKSVKRLDPAYIYNTRPVAGQ